MSLLKAIKAQLGLSNTPANNFTITAEADNGSLKLARGNAGATTQDILTVDASGLVGFPVSKAIETPVKDALNATGSAPVYACRAWVNFNGTGTVAIRASGNVSSITDNGAGKYTLNFTTAMPNTNYAVVCAAGESEGLAFVAAPAINSRTVSSVQIIVSDNNSETLLDSADVNVSIFG